MIAVGYHLVGNFDIFERKNNLDETGLPQRWFVVYAGTQQ